MKQKVVLYAAIFVLLVTVVNLFSGDGKNYHLDLFSVISFGLAIAAFMLSIFAAWLSWEFYKKSTETLDLVRSSVSSIETSVSGVQSNITEIVQTAVKHWTQNAAVGTETQYVAEEAYRELKDKIDAVKGTDPELQTKLDSFLSGINESMSSLRAQAIFPSGKFEPPIFGPSILVSQHVDEDTAEKLSGRVTFDVRRNTKNATCRLQVENVGRFDSVDLELIALPSGVGSQEFKLRHGIDRNFHLNVHLAGDIKEGTYVIAFRAERA